MIREPLLLPSANAILRLVGESTLSVTAVMVIFADTVVASRVVTGDQSLHSRLFYALSLKL